MPGKLELATHPRRFYAQDCSTPSWWALSVQNEVSRLTAGALRKTGS